MLKRCPSGRRQWQSLLLVAFLAAPALIGATLNPVAINALAGGPYLSTNYVSGAPVAGYDGEGNGIFTADNEVQWFTFTLGDPADIYIQTISWATMGGFAPELTLFNDDGSPTGFGGSSSPGTYPACGALGVVDSLCLDAVIQVTLDAGTYRLALTQAGNSTLGSAGAGFQFDAANSPCATANYTGGDCLGYGGAGAFYAAYGDHPQLNGSWALSVGAGVPEPAPGVLVFVGLAALMAVVKLRVGHLTPARVCAQSNTSK